ncbi:MAG: methyltransferase protein [Herbaspirillum sp.]|jgi:SAM-dependent methyltransferase|nr:methyltransferase protein [Herbaspirillum sp.]
MNMPTREHFERLYTDDPDPWCVADSWYERRKRQILLAMLPMPYFQQVYEPACGTGELTAQLAQRCAKLVASDFSERAVAIARQKTAQLPHVGVMRQDLPRDWTRMNRGGHPLSDLIVISELCYYLSADAMPELVHAALAGLTPDGYLIACHCRHAFDDRLQATAAIHHMFNAHAALAHRARYEDGDFLIDLWRKSADKIGVELRSEKGDGL